MFLNTFQAWVSVLIHMKSWVSIEWIDQIVAFDFFNNDYQYEWKTTRYLKDISVPWRTCSLEHKSNLNYKSLDLELWHTRYLRLLLHEQLYEYVFLKESIPGIQCFHNKLQVNYSHFLQYSQYYQKDHQFCFVYYRTNHRQYLKWLYYRKGRHLNWYLIAKWLISRSRYLPFAAQFSGLIGIKSAFEF